MVNPLEYLEEFTFIIDDQKNNGALTILNQSVIRSAEKAETLGRELKKKIRKNVSDWSTLESLMAPLSPAQLIELQTFLWKEAMNYSETTLEKKLAREFITSRMEPTSNYHRRQMCGEPLTACRANYCIHSNPLCASRKIKEQIRAIASVFDRRNVRNVNRDQALELFLKNLIKRYGLFAAIVTTATGLPVAALSDLEQNNEQSDFVKYFYKHLEQYIKSEKSNGSVFFDATLQAVSQKIATPDQNFILTLLSIRNTNLDIAIFQSALGITRIYSQNTN